MNRSDAFTYSADPIENGTPTDGGADWAGGGNYGTNGSVMYRNGGAAEKYLECSVTDHEVEVKLTTLGSQSGVIARVSGGNYYAWIRSGGGGTMELYKVPTFDLLGTGSAPSAGDTIYLRCEGTTISAGINGAESCSVTDSTHSTGTKAGVHSGDQYDDFTITDLTGGGSPPAAFLPAFAPGFGW
jgi:hypothetical protein